MLRRVWIPLLLLSAACDSGTAPPDNIKPLDPPALHVNVMASGGNETSAAINPVLAGWLAGTWQSPTMVGWSSDSGQTWHAVRTPGLIAYQISGDPVLFYDADGHLYSLSLAFDRPDDYHALGRAAHRNGIFLNRSDDGGVTWRAQATTVVADPEVPGTPFEDKPGAAVDRSNDPNRRGTIHVAWTQFRMNNSGIRYARSTDGGLSFSTPVEISDRPGIPFDTTGVDEGTDVVVAPNGNVFVVWTDSTGIWLDRSTDNGSTWGADVLVARTSSMFFVVPGVFRADGFPSIDVDSHGRLYVNWVDDHTGHYVPWLTTSTDNGRTWSTPRAVAGGGVTATSDRFFSWLAADPTRDLVVVGYYRTEALGEFAYYLAASNNAGASFQEWRWGTQSFMPGGAFIGDYTGVDVYKGTAHGVWTESNFNATTGRVSAQVWSGRAVFR